MLCASCIAANTTVPLSSGRCACTTTVKTHRVQYITNLNQQQSTFFVVIPYLFALVYFPILSGDPRVNLNIVRHINRTISHYHSTQPPPPPVRFESQRRHSNFRITCRCTNQTNNIQNTLRVHSEALSEKTKNIFRTHTKPRRVIKNTHVQKKQQINIKHSWCCPKTHTNHHTRATQSHVRFFINAGIGGAGAYRGSSIEPFTYVHYTYESFQSTEATHYLSLSFCALQPPRKRVVIVFPLSPTKCVVTTIQHYLQTSFLTRDEDKQFKHKRKRNTHTHTHKSPLF